VSDLNSQDWVRSANLNYCFEFDKQYVPNDKKWSKLWGDIPDGLNWGVEAIDIQKAWDYKDSMKNKVNIGVIDNMFDVNHEDLIFSEEPLGNILAKNNCEWNNHGTHTSGTIAATIDNKKGISGISLNHNLYGVSYEGMAVGKYDTIQSMRIALYYLIASKNCSVINMSIGVDHLTFEASRNGKVATKEITELAAGIEEVLQLLIDKGYQFVICKSAGNQNEVGGSYRYFRKDSDDTEYQYDYYNYGDYLKYLNGESGYEYFDRYKDKKDEIENRVESGNVDANFDFMGIIKNEKVKERIIVVGAAENLGTRKEGGFLWFGRETKHNGYKIASFSQCGDRVDVLAPGVDIYSCAQNGYVEMPGTSMAAPHVSGVAAMLFSIKPDLVAGEAKRLICNTATGEFSNNNITYGLLNANNAINELLKDGNNETKEEENINEEITIDPSYPTTYDESSMKFQRMVAKDENYTFMKDLNGKLERKNNDGTAGDKVLYDKEFFTICGIDASYIYLLKGSEKDGVYDIVRISKDGKKTDTLLQSINWCLHMDSDYFYYVPSDNNKCIRRLNRAKITSDNYCEFNEPVEVLIPQDNNFMVVTKEDSIFAFFGGATNNFYLIDKNGATIKEYGSEITVEDYPREKNDEGGYNTAIKYVSNGYLRSTAAEVHLQYGGSFINAEGISGWNPTKNGIVTTLNNDVDGENALPYRIMLYNATSGVSQKMTEVHSNQAFFTMCQDDNGNWCYIDEVDNKFILYSLSNDFGSKEIITEIDAGKFNCSLETCGMEIMDNRIYFYSMPDNKTANAIYRYDLILED